MRSFENAQIILDKERFGYLVPVLGGPHTVVPFGGTANNHYILKAIAPLFKSLHDGHLHLVAVLRY